MTLFRASEITGVLEKQAGGWKIVQFRYTHICRAKSLNTELSGFHRIEDGRDAAVHLVSQLIATDKRCRYED